jgi:hypothetical protein
MTTTHAKLAAEDLARELSEKLKPFGVTEAKVDDWNDYNEFSILAFLDVQPSHTKKGAFRPKNDKTFNMRKIVANLRKVLNGAFGTPNHRFDTVQRLYTVIRRFDGSCETGAKLFDGYERDYIYITANFDWLNRD